MTPDGARRESTAVAGQGLPPAWRRVRIVLIGPVGYRHTATFQELADGLLHAFEALGARVDIAHNALLRTGGINVVLGAHLLAETPEAGSLPPDAVIVNLEQMASGDFAVQPAYRDLLQRHRVWDYSWRNIAYCRDRLGVKNIQHLRIGYVPQLQRVPVVAEPDIDVLFYGSINERRRNILAALEQAGLRVRVLLGVFGAERDSWIARSKMVLNVHYYEDKVHEIVRSSYLLANGKAVVCECDDDTEIDEDIRRAVVAAPYPALVRTCVELAGSDARRREVETRALAIFIQRDQVADLGKVIALTPPPALPTRINLGSGKSWDAGYLNIDIDAKWRPDLLADLSDGSWVGRAFACDRFGECRLSEGCFEEIVTLDVLEHVPDLPAFMTSCLALLRTGGVMRIGVPYDLSLGAWQDPTHVRAFNEMSWRYYTDWHWYLGWTQARFDLTEQTFMLSAYGKARHDAGAPLEELLRLPRAVDSIQVVLTKRLLTPEEAAAAEAVQGRGL